MSFRNFVKFCFTSGNYLDCNILLKQMRVAAQKHLQIIIENSAIKRMSKLSQIRLQIYHNAIGIFSGTSEEP